MNRLGITTDCVCDLPDEYIKVNDIGVVYFYIITTTGRFRDGYEIDAENLIEYMEDGGEKAETTAPAPEEYKAFFEKQLKKYEQIIHISISDKVSLSYSHALKALENMGVDGRRVHVVDSEHLSTGMGHLVIRAVDLMKRRNNVDEILEDLDNLKNRISTSFIANNADYLYRNGKVSKAVKTISSLFMMHPILTMKNGRISLKGVQFGNYENSIKRYIRSELRGSSKIDRRRLFITSAGCPIKMIAEIKANIRKICTFEEVLSTKASATVTSNCGKGAIGVLFVRKK